MLLTPIAFGGGLGPPPTISYLTDDQQAAGSPGPTSITWSGKTLGTAAADRIIIVAIDGYSNVDNTQATTVTIAGISATKLVSIIGNLRVVAGLWAAAVPTGTTGNIVINWGSGMIDQGIAIYRMVGGLITPGSTTSDNTITSNALSASVTISSDAVCIGTVHGDSTGAGPRTWTWTNLTEDLDTSYGAFNGSYSAGRRTTVGTSTITATASGEVNNGAALVLAVFRGS